MIHLRIDQRLIVWWVDRRVFTTIGTIFHTCESRIFGFYFHHFTDLRLQMIYGSLLK